MPPETATALALLAAALVLGLPVLLLHAAANRPPSAVRVRELIEAEQYAEAVRTAIQGLTFLPSRPEGLGAELLSINWELFYLARRAAFAWEEAPPTLAAELEILRQSLLEFERFQNLWPQYAESMRRETEAFRARLRSRDLHERRAACADLPAEVRAHRDYTESRRRLKALLQS